MQKMHKKNTYIQKPLKFILHKQNTNIFIKNLQSNMRQN